MTVDSAARPLRLSLPPTRCFSYVKVWSGVLRAEGVVPDEQEIDVAESKARAAFGACVCAINAVNSVVYRFAAEPEVRVCCTAGATGVEV